jgi:hypothetical protein
MGCVIPLTRLAPEKTPHRPSKPSPAEGFRSARDDFAGGSCTGRETGKLGANLGGFRGGFLQLGTEKTVGVVLDRTRCDSVRWLAKSQINRGR